jgi:uncharacterized protein YbjT (DUF2867 family)
MPQHTILVTGATGKQGGAVVRHLLAAGYPVRALTRDPDGPAAGDLRERGVEVLGGDLADPAAVRRALADVYGLFSVQTFGMTLAGTYEETRQGVALAEAAAAAGVRHVVHSSVGGVDRDSGIPHFENKLPVERHFTALGVPTTFLRPVFFMENFDLFFARSVADGVVALPLDPDRAVQMIAVDDIGALAAAAFQRPGEFLGQAIEIAGDEVTMTGIARALTDHLGHPVTYRQVPDMYAGPGFFDSEFRVMFDWYATAGYAADIPAVRKLLPGLRTLPDWLGDTDWGRSA